MSSYRTLLGIVEQDVFLFDGTVAENIAYADGRKRRGDHGAANATTSSTQPEKGYQTLIGERGGAT